ncbi:peptide ligase PGM1-related protein [Streptomyces lateritius]|uniref:Peptide ligase PGM1-related protein n=1 Tax=Streptomyces lateritius TaxID=67313 RepID=A0ABW6Y826_9ACTN
MDGTGPVVVFANFLSDLAVDLEESGALAQWAEQAPRKAWLLRPGDVLVTPVPVSEAFLRYVGGLTRVPADEVTVVEVPSAAGGSPSVGAVPMGQALREAGLTERLRTLADGSGGALLPTALDASAVTLARDLGITVRPFPTVEAAAAALEVTRRLNTKAGFREVAAELGVRLPDGRVCRRGEVHETVRALLRTYDRVVVKPDRSAGGHGLRFVSRGDPTWTEHALEPVGGPDGTWVVEECVDVAESVSVQLEVSPAGTRPLYSGVMRTSRGAYTGYASPLPPASRHVSEELERWGRALGGHLARCGYAGPLGLDAMVTTDGTLLAGESNVRRTATTTVQAMVDRLGALSGRPPRAWSVGKGRARRRFGFQEAVDRLTGHGLAFDPARGEGVVLYADAPPDGHSWRYAVIGEYGDGVAEQEARLAAALEFPEVRDSHARVLPRRASGPSESSW